MIEILGIWILFPGYLKMLFSVEYWITIELSYKSYISRKKQNEIWILWLKKNKAVKEEDDYDIKTITY